mmetsp:Transcript_6974/g.18937  ORF Transcript_6974/g.18937 Transcript_6974/m.18937 type:complete len:242 (+) Transcript_6974:129-854(+)
MCGAMIQPPTPHPQHPSASSRCTHLLPLRHPLRPRIHRLGTHRTNPTHRRRSHRHPQRHQAASRRDNSTTPSRQTAAPLCPLLKTKPRTGVWVRLMDCSLRVRTGAAARARLPTNPTRRQRRIRPGRTWPQATTADHLPPRHPAAEEAIPAATNAKPSLGLPPHPRSKTHRHHLRSSSQQVRLHDCYLPCPVASDGRACSAFVRRTLTHARRKQYASSHVRSCSRGWTSISTRKYERSIRC